MHFHLTQKPKWHKLKWSNQRETFLPEQNEAPLMLLKLNKEVKMIWRFPWNTSLELTQLCETFLIWERFGEAPDIASLQHQHSCFLLPPQGAGSAPTCWKCVMPVKNDAGFPARTDPRGHVVSQRSRTSLLLLLVWKVIEEPQCFPISCESLPMALCPVLPSTKVS